MTCITKSIYTAFQCLSEIKSYEILSYSELWMRQMSKIVDRDVVMLALLKAVAVRTLKKKNFYWVNL